MFHLTLVHTQTMRTRPFPWPLLIRHALLAVALNSAIALTLTIVSHDSLGANMVYSQLIGLSIWALIDVGRFALQPRGQINLRQAMVLTLLGCTTGYFLGSAVGDIALGHASLIGWRYMSERMLGYFLLSLVAGSVLVYFFMSREVLLQERNERELAQRQATEAQLKLLQSQLDPHMLFNTLANLRALIAQEPARAVQMLDQLCDFLRATLSASRAQEHSLQAEFDRLRDYLSLMQIRLGQRLRFSLNLPPELSQIKVPTLILQSLVENAVLHGLEPKVGGGSVQISAAQSNGQLILQVTDDGMGWREPSHLANGAPNSGFGLSQVQERLNSRYGKLATMDFIAGKSIEMRANGLFLSQNAVIDGMPATDAHANTGCQVTLRIPLQA